MGSTILNRRFKAPRWVNTEAGQWAYEVNEEWRKTANLTFGVTERRLLLDEAAKLRQQKPTESA